MGIQIKPLSKIIGLSTLLAVGFLFIALPTALYGNWMPVIDGFIFGIAYLPYLFTHTGADLDYQTGLDDIDDISTSSASDFGKWITSFLVFSGIAFPIILSRNNLLPILACIFSILGGLFIYSTIVIFTTFFDKINSDDDPFSF